MVASIGKILLSDRIPEIFTKREIKFLCFCLGCGENPLLDSPEGIKAMDFISSSGLSPKRSLPGLIFSYSEFYQPSNNSFHTLQSLIQSILNSIEKPNLYEQNLLDFKDSIFTRVPDNEMANVLKNWEGCLIDFFLIFLIS